jgi:hypothetical protein
MPPPDHLVNNYLKKKSRTNHKKILMRPHSVLEYSDNEAQVLRPQQKVDQRSIAAD